jgi:CRP-like cAMP-binding protein
MAEAARLCTLGRGEIVFREGEIAREFYLILTGKISVERSAGLTVPQPVDHVRSGEVLGWSWLLAPFRWHFQARALEPTETIAINAPQMLVACEEHPECGYELMKAVAQIIIHRLQAVRSGRLNA